MNSNDMGIYNCALAKRNNSACRHVYLTRNTLETTISYTAPILSKRAGCYACQPCLVRKGAL